MSPQDIALAAAMLVVIFGPLLWGFHLYTKDMSEQFARKRQQRLDEIEAEISSRRQRRLKDNSASRR